MPQVLLPEILRALREAVEECASAILEHPIPPPSGPTSALIVQQAASLPPPAPNSQPPLASPGRLAPAQPTPEDSSNDEAIAQTMQVEADAEFAASLETRRLWRNWRPDSSSASASASAPVSAAPADQDRVRLILELKREQRRNPVMASGRRFQDEWHTFCDRHSSRGDRDPWRHDTAFIARFFREHPPPPLRGRRGGQPSSMDRLQDLERTTSDADKRLGYGNRCACAETRRQLRLT